jgi:hypothetical protein
LCERRFLQKNFLVPGEIPLAARAQTSMKRPLIAWLSLGERTSSWVFANCVAGVVSLCKRRGYDHSYRGFNAPLPDDGVLTTGRRNFFNMPHEPSLRISVH